MFRMRITFSKSGAARFAGHLDLHKAWERALRRAGAPIAYSEGFHPQPKIQLASALPLGFTSQAEVADVWLTEAREPEQLHAALAAAMPPGLEVLAVEPVLEKEKSLQSRLRAAEYRVRLTGEIETVRTRIAELLGRGQILRERRNKEYDLRPLILELQVAGVEGNAVYLSLRLAAREGATGRPEEVLDALGYDSHAAAIHRTRLIFVDNKT